MGIAKSGLIGPFSKKVGPAVGRKRRGQNILTALHREITTPPSEDQLAERAKFGMLNSFLSDIESLVLEGFKKYSKNKYALNVAYTYNCDHAFVYENAPDPGEQEPDMENPGNGEATVSGQWKLNYPKLVYSRGRVNRPEGATVALTAQGILFTWKPQPQSATCQFTDMASFLIYNSSKGKALSRTAVANRYAGQYLHTEIPPRFAGDTLHCYMSFAAANGKETGNSVYLGELVWG